jgi:hypothetical protein
MPLRDDLLRGYLAKGNFPLLSQAGIGLWSHLLDELEADAEGTLKAIKKAMTLLKRVEFDEAFSTEIEVNNVSIDTGQSDLEVFLGHAHADLCKDHGMASRDNVQLLIQRLRVLMHGSIEESSIILGLDPTLKMGNGLIANTLTCMPDPAWHVTYGSVPDQKVIGMKAPLWNVLKRRTYESKAPVRYGAKPHYVLAHLLNHNVNGPGDNPLNVVPFWAAANTQMAQQVEGHLKDLVLRGLMVRYVISFGAAVGMTPGRSAALSNCTSQDQTDIIEAEQHLPDSLTLTITYIDASTGAETVVVPPQVIENFVPETVPLLR